MGAGRDISAWDFAAAIATAVIGMAAATIGLFLWPDPPVAGVPLTFGPEGGSAVATVTDLTPLKGEYPIELHMASGEELRAIGVSRQKLLEHVKLSVSYDGGANYLRLLIPRASAYEDEIDAPHLGIGSMHNPQSATAMVRVQVDAGVNWPPGMRLVVKNDWLSSSKRQDSRVTMTHLLLLGGLVVGALLLIAPLWIWSFYQRRRRAKPQAAVTKVSCPADAKRLRRELENPRR